MKLSRIYSNKPEIFVPIEFQDGLNVVLAEIREPENREKDTHNLGKTTLSRLIDFCLLKQKDKDFFLFKHHDRFADFEFFLEIKLAGEEFLTIRRSVENATKISFKKHKKGRQEFVQLSESEWDHFDVAFDRAKQLLDGILDLKAIAPFDYRDAIGYSLRVQDDYGDIFQLGKFRGKHSDWKPYLAKMLGFNTDLVVENYTIANEIEALESDATSLRADLVGGLDDLDKIDGVLVIKQSQATDLERQVRQYNFHLADAKITEELVNDIESQIASLNQRRYYLNMHQKRIRDSLREKIVFDPDSAQALFQEAGVLFQGQIKKQFEDLKRFNAAIAEERVGILEEELKQITVDLAEIETQLSHLNDKRTTSLAILDDKQFFAKYRKMTARWVEVKADLEVLTRQRKAAQEFQNIQNKIIAKKARRTELRQLIEENISAPNERYRSIRLFFTEIIKSTIDRDVVLSTRVNENGNLEFSAEILNEKGAETS